MVGLHILGFLTAKCGTHLSSEVLAGTYGTSPVVIRRVLSKLNRAGLVASQRGAGGGSVLAKDPSTITLREIYEAVTESSEILPRYPESEGGVADVLGAYVNDLCRAAEDALFAQLESVTIAEMDQKVRPEIVRKLRNRNKAANEKA